MRWYLSKSGRSDFDILKFEKNFKKYECRNWNIQKQIKFNNFYNIQILYCLILTVLINFLTLDQQMVVNPIRMFLILTKLSFVKVRLWKNFWSTSSYVQVLNVLKFCNNLINSLQKLCEFLMKIIQSVITRFLVEFGKLF